MGKERLMLFDSWIVEYILLFDQSKSPVTSSVLVEYHDMMSSVRDRIQIPEGPAQWWLDQGVSVV